MRTSLHGPSFIAHNTLWRSFQGFVRHSMSSVAPATMPLADEPCQDSPPLTHVHEAWQPTRRGLYMRMTLAERDSLVKHHVARLPLYAHQLMGAYQDPHQNTIIVLADMRQSSLACSSTPFFDDEVQHSFPPSAPVVLCM